MASFSCQTNPILLTYTQTSSIMKYEQMSGYTGSALFGLLLFKRLFVTMNRWLSYLVILLMIYAFCLALSNIVVGTLFLDESTCASSNQTQKLIPIGLMVDGIVMLFYLPIKFLYNFDTFMSQGLDPKDFYTGK